MKESNGQQDKQAFITALVRGFAFAVITFLYTYVTQLNGFLWYVYVGFFVTMALGAKKRETINYICSLLIGCIWSAAYMYMPSFLENLFHISKTFSMTISELLITFLLIFTHLKFLKGTVFNKVPIVFAAIAMVFASRGYDYVIYYISSVILGIVMAVFTEIIIQMIRAE